MGIEVIEGAVVFTVSQFWCGVGLTLFVIVVAFVVASVLAGRKAIAEEEEGDFYAWLVTCTQWIEAEALAGQRENLNKIIGLAEQMRKRVRQEQAKRRELDDNS